MKVTSKDKKVTVDQAFRGMILYLDKYYEIFKSDVLADILSALHVCSDGKTVDPAAGAEWIDCLQQAISDDSLGKHTFPNRIENLKDI